MYRLSVRIVQKRKERVVNKFLREEGEEITRRIWNNSWLIYGSWYDHSMDTFWDSPSKTIGVPFLTHQTYSSVLIRHWLRLCGFGYDNVNSLSLCNSDDDCHLPRSISYILTSIKTFPHIRLPFYLLFYTLNWLNVKMDSNQYEIYSWIMFGLISLNSDVFTIV